MSRFPNPDSLQDDDVVEHEGDRFERSIHMHRAAELDSEIEVVSTPYGAQDLREWTPNDSWGSEIQALPEAHDYLEEMSDHLSSHCEGGHFEPALTMRQEGDGQQSASSEADRLNIDLESMRGVDNGPSFLGSFVLRTRTQDHCVSESRHSLCNQKRQISNFVFEHEVVRAKVWFAPDGGCSKEARDTYISADSFENVCEYLCTVWSDRIDLHLCSCQVVWPQPSEHFAVDTTHFLVFLSQGPTAVLVRQVILSNRNPTRVDFCACAAAFMNRESTLQQLSKVPRRRGELVDIEAVGAESVCDSHRTEVATHFGDDISLMQAMGSFASMVGLARFEYAVENQCCIHPIADYTRQNFIKKDGLRQWFRGFMHGVNEDSIRLAIWKVEMSKAVTLSCKYLLLDDSNWARQFRSIWRSDPGSSTPEIAMVEPQPPSISSDEDKPKHVIAIEHNRMPADQVVHLYDIWWTDDPHIGTGREFLARRAVRTRRSLSINQIAEILGLVNSQKEQHFYALHRLAGGQSMFQFQDYQNLGVPDFSHVDFIILEQKSACENSLDERGPAEKGVPHVSSSVDDRPQSNRAGDNTATPVYDDALTGLMQTTA